MDKYSDLYMQTHCIDVFFRHKGIPVHVLTRGCRIPETLNDLKRNRTLQERTELSVRENLSFRNVLDLDVKNNFGIADRIIVNEDYWAQLVENSKAVLREHYHKEYEEEVQDLLPSLNEFANHFAIYASLGFYSYICDDVHEDGTATYVLIAHPRAIAPTEMDLPEFDIDNIPSDIISMPDTFRM